MEESLARSHSCRSSSQLGARKVSSVRKQSDSFVDKVQLSTPINQAESYQQPKSVNDQQHFVNLLVDNLLHKPCDHQSRQSAASLKVHFQSVDDVTDQPIDDQHNSVNVDLNDNSSDARPRCHSGKYPLKTNLIPSYKSIVFVHVLGALFVDLISGFPL